MANGAASTRSNTSSGTSRPVSKCRVLRRPARRSLSSISQPRSSGPPQGPEVEAVVAVGEAQCPQPLRQPLQPVLLGEADGAVELVGQRGGLGRRRRDPPLGGSGVGR